jgi:hypothetical protein
LTQYPGAKVEAYARGLKLYRSYQASYFRFNRAAGILGDGFPHLGF